MLALLIALAGIAALPDAARAQPTAARPPGDDRARIAELEAEGKALRAHAEATYRAAEAACHERFLVNRCIDQAKKERLDTITRARGLEAEARRLDLAERQRAADAARARAIDAPPAEHQPAQALPVAPDLPQPPATPETPAAEAPTPSASDTALPETAPDAARLRAEREAASRAAQDETERARAARDTERAAERRQAEEEAAARAAQAERDRERYDERLRKYEEEQAGKR